jgi:hypothetical protein
LIKFILKPLIFLICTTQVMAETQNQKLKMTPETSPSLKSSDILRKTVSYTSIAKNQKKQVQYKEKHTAEFDGVKPLTAKTEYSDNNDKIIGVMESNFTKNITTPEYEFKDVRTGESHGITLDENNYILWRKTKDGAKEEKKFNRKDMDKDALVVGCQGLHYYLIGNLETIQKQKTMPIKYFMPGRLDYYRFNLKVEKEDEEFIYLKLSINNFVLKMFTDSLNMKYSKLSKNLVYYSGLSNITDDKGELQNVYIEYTY